MKSGNILNSHHLVLLLTGLFAMTSMFESEQSMWAMLEVRLMVAAIVVAMLCSVLIGIHDQDAGSEPDKEDAGDVEEVFADRGNSNVKEDKQ